MGVGVAWTEGHQGLAPVRLYGEAQCIMGNGHMGPDSPPRAENDRQSDMTENITLNFGGHESFLWGHWYPCFGLLVTSPLGFKVRVGSALFKLSGGVCVTLHVPWDSPLVQHLPTCWRPAWQPSHLFHIPAKHWCNSKPGAIMPPLTVWDQAHALPPELSWSVTSHNVRSGRCSTDWAIPARLLLTVWDQADTLLTELSWLGRCSQCEIRQMLYQLSYPSLAAAHSVRSGRCSTDWAMLAQPPLAVWDQADALPTELSRLGRCSQCEIRQTLYQLSYAGSATAHSVRSGRCYTDWAILAQPLLTMWDQADALQTELSRLSCCSQCEIRQMLYWLSYPGLAAAHSVRSGRCSTDWAIPARPLLTMWDQADAILTELSWLSRCSQCEIRQTLYRLSYPGSAMRTLPFHKCWQSLRSLDIALHLGTPKSV